MSGMGALQRVLIERYRSPESLLRLGLLEPLREEKVFFRYGQNLLCYGRGRARHGSTRQLHDAAEDTLVRGSVPFLSFDPSEVVENLRNESYLPAESGVRSFAKKAYYFARPLLTPSFRQQIQQFQLRGWETSAFPKWPVDTTVEDLCEQLLLDILKASGEPRIPFIWFWPEGKSICFLMTHDVESVDGRDYTSQLMDIDDSFGLKASFQIVPQGRYEVTYEYLDTIRNRDFEICIQDFNHDGKLFDDRQEFLRRANLINDYAQRWGAKGFRAAVLYRKPEWYDKLEISFDMSVPNVAHLDPQRGGCCTVMPYFIGEVLELPVTTTQDYMVFYLLKDRSIDLWKRQISLISRKYGLVNFIVHPDYVQVAEIRALYEELLGYAKHLENTQNLWLTVPSAVNNWWRARSRMTLVSSQGGWRVEGKDAHRARVAYALNVGGKLVYELEPALAARS
jgi:hypothetical protein